MPLPADIPEPERARLKVLARPWVLATYRLLLNSERALSVSGVQRAQGGTQTAVRSRLHALRDVGLAESLQGGWWRAIRVPIHVPTDFTHPECGEAARRITLAFMSEAHARRSAWIDTSQRPEMEKWRDAAIQGDWTIYVTPSELQEIEMKLRGLLREFGTPTPGKSPVFLAVFAAPDDPKS